MTAREHREQCLLDHGFLAEDGFDAGDKLSLADCILVPWIFYGNMLTQTGDDALTRRPKLARYVAFITQLELAKRILGEMDESFRAFMARWKAEQEAVKEAVKAD